MTDIPRPRMYKRLAKVLNTTRKTLTQACTELDIILDNVEDDLLQQEIDQCSHCNIWSFKLIEDLDGIPVCPVCVRLVGV